jgi:spermidine synthase
MTTNATPAVSIARSAALNRPETLWRYYLLFFVSGFPALIYQIVWQRALFTIYGVNIESVTVIVTVFMLGLGLGSLAGGRLSTMEGIPALRTFGVIEFSIGVFGATSLWLFHSVARLTAGVSTSATGVITFFLLLVPTLLMGSTLPLLVAHLVRRTANVGESVGSLYAVNTLGSAAACLCSALFLMRLLGESGAVRLAAVLNIVVGIAASLFASRKAPGDQTATRFKDRSGELEHRTISFAAGVLLAAVAGFVALGYEILWYRIYSFVSGGSASCFAKLLAFYLFGVAYGSFAVHDACKNKLKNDLRRTLRAGSLIVLLGSVTAFLAGPCVASSVSSLHLPYDLTFALVAISAALTGAAFPIVSHAAIGPTEQAGKRLSYLYLSNIVGSALGSFLVGFVVLNYWTTGQASYLLLGFGIGIAMAFWILARPFSSWTIPVVSVVVCAVLAGCSHRLFSDMYERLLFKRDYKSGTPFANLVENRSGVIAVDSGDTVYGGGSYDGRFNIDPVNDANGVFRAYALPGLHPDPKRVLVIGLSSGSWAQIVANDPRVQDMTIVEINPGYLPLIRQHQGVASLLDNPKVHVVIDDGRRWLVSHPHQRFDLILMNTTYNWRANVTNLLSMEFLRLMRQHLEVGGIGYYNTTSSPEVQATGASAFPYALRVANFLAVSDSPIMYDREKLRSILASYRIDGRSVFDLSKSAYQNRLEDIASLPQIEDSESTRFGSIEDRASMLKRLAGERPITDDNMGTEWK